MVCVHYLPKMLLPYVRIIVIVSAFITVASLAERNKKLNNFPVNDLQV